MISPQQALDLYHRNSLNELAAYAAKTTNRLHDPAIRTYVIERNINYTNVCRTHCRFCAFCATQGSLNAYVLSHDQIAQKIEPLIALGGTQILLQGGCHPDLPFDFYENMLAYIKKRFPKLHIHAFSPPEITYFSEKYELTIPDVIQRLRLVGLDTIPGGGAEILVDRVRELISPAKCSANQWLEVMRQAHRLGMHTTTTMMFGHVETIPERIEHLERLRALQAESLNYRQTNPEAGCFTAFTCWPFQPGNTRLAQLPQYNPQLDPERLPDQLELAGAYQQLKMTALARIYLDNIPNQQASWVTQGPNIGQLSLLAGCNDFGSLMMEENVVAAAGATFQLQLTQLQRLISEIGFKPVQRDCYYNHLNA
ncbi:MAG: dehypoxanthine futalosine cyclase [Planctomycetes bacterium]|nr:dehypoxanthine futalosine cyclase [Planctomycetota bacterium]